MTVESITAAGAAAQETQRETLVLAKLLRVQREQAQATVALIEQAGTPAAAAGRLLDVRA